ncbi:hypothetical protein IWQ56_000344 [Coemansia nantahalensis]|nr:hypothetical protein IWQ56_000344 [Coemansia nantahalensis]
MSGYDGPVGFLGAAAPAAAVGTPISNSTHWSSDETRLLIRTWGAHRDEFAEIKRNLSVWNKVLDRLLHAGFVRSVEQCRNRWKFLESKYKAAQREVETTGRTAWELFDDMERAKGGIDVDHARHKRSRSGGPGYGGSSASYHHAPSASLFVDPHGRVQLPPIRPALKSRVPDHVAGDDVARRMHAYSTPAARSFRYSPDRPSVPALAPPSPPPPPPMRKRSLDGSSDDLHGADTRRDGMAALLAGAAGPVRPIGEVRRADILDFLREQAAVREQYAAQRAEERRRAEEMRTAEEWRFHEFQMSVVGLIQAALLPHAALAASPSVTSHSPAPASEPSPATVAATVADTQYDSQHRLLSGLKSTSVECGSYPRRVGSR